MIISIHRFIDRYILGHPRQIPKTLFLEAGLVDGTNEETVAFWDALAARAKGQTFDRLLAIGREGERLTLAFEQQRTGKNPKWVSIESNEDGYDILSVIDTQDLRPLSIEVKATRVGIHGNFHITRNEWDRAKSGFSHIFHFWDMSSTIPKLAVVTADNLERHIPLNCGEGEWELTCVPFEPFGCCFADIKPVMASC